MTVLGTIKAVLASDVFSLVCGAGLFVGCLYVLYCMVSGRQFKD